MAKVYFQPEWRGSVYSVPEEACVFAGDVAQLKDGRLVELEVLEVKPPIVKEVHFVDEVPTVGGRKGRIWQATVEIDCQEGEGIFKDSWDPFIPKLNAAAAVNTLYWVILTPEEHKRLMKGGLEELKAKLSPRAANLLYVWDEWTFEDGEHPALQLLRTGRCQY